MYQYSTIANFYLRTRVFHASIQPVKLRNELIILPHPIDTFESLLRPPILFLGGEPGSQNVEEKSHQIDEGEESIRGRGET